MPETPSLTVYSLTLNQNRQISMEADIQTFITKLNAQEQEICNILYDHITQHLAGAEAKVWHAHPVWFLDGNPIVGFSLKKCGVNLMFWSGQSFGEDNLVGLGKFKAADICYSTIKDVRVDDIARWCEKGRAIQWDYKNIVKRKGVLEKLVWEV